MKGNNATRAAALLDAAEQKRLLANELWSALHSFNDALLAAKAGGLEVNVQIFGESKPGLSLTIREVILFGEATTTI